MPELVQNLAVGLIVIGALAVLVRRAWKASAARSGGAESPCACCTLAAAPGNSRTNRKSR